MFDTRLAQAETDDARRERILLDMPDADEGDFVPGYDPAPLCMHAQCVREWRLTGEALCLRYPGSWL